jgi:hypothetical protein
VGQWSVGQLVSGELRRAVIGHLSSVIGGIVKGGKRKLSDRIVPGFKCVLSASVRDRAQAVVL